MSPRPGAAPCPPVPRGPRTPDPPQGKPPLTHPRIQNLFCFKLDAKSIPEALATTFRILEMRSIALAHRYPGRSWAPQDRPRTPRPHPTRPPIRHFPAFFLTQPPTPNPGFFFIRTPPPQHPIPHGGVERLFSQKAGHTPPKEKPSKRRGDISSNRSVALTAQVGFPSIDRAYIACGCSGRCSGTLL